MNKIVLAHFALFSANLIYALNYIVAKDVMPTFITPSSFVLMRVIGGFVFFSTVYIFLIRQKIEIRDIYYLFFCSLFGVVINMLLFFEGLSLTSPISASIIMITTPLLVYFISVSISIERYSITKFLGVILGLIGAVILISNGNSFRISSLGDFLVFINAISYSIYLIMVKKMMTKYHPITVLSIIFFFGLIIILPINYDDLSSVNFTNLPLSIVFKILFVVLFTTCMAYFLNIFALSKLKSSIVAFYIYLQPLLATIISLFWGKDVLSSIKIIAASLIFLGIYFVVYKR